MEEFFGQSVNIVELEAVRSKLLQLQETFNFFLQTVNPELPIAAWPEILNKFNILVAKYVNLNNEIINPIFKKLVLHPNEPATTDQENQIMGVLLRTKQIPEIERGEQEVKEEVSIPEDIKALMENDIAAMQNALSIWQAKIKKYDSFCNFAEETFDKHMDKAILKTRYVPEEEKDISEDIGMEEVDKKSLEETLAWISSGPK
ncbi:hypothetical protein K7432_002262 [Basidiobolus ranarum]|uniref:Mediator of RNA polymerase II transcription subunit 8 n=1 Tax=Basidiobolus ranarum TaxID=34480 RepID=A0ABR2W866_9FUNG